MSEERSQGRIISIDEGLVKSQLGRVVRETVEQTLNKMLDAEADELCGAKRYARSPDRIDTRAGHYERTLDTKAGRVKLKVPKLRTIPFESAIIDRYRRRESSVEEALMEMYLAGVSVRRVEDITEALWGTRVSAGIVSKLNQELYDKIDLWRTRPIEGAFPYVYLDGIVLKRTWADEIRNVSILVAFGVNADGYREILGAVEGAKEDKAGWGLFIASLKQRGLDGVQLFISDKCMGLVESLSEYYPEVPWQRCAVHFYRNVFSNVPSTKVKEVAAMLKAIHAQEDRDASVQKAELVIEKLKAMKLPVAAKTVEDGIRETLTYTAFPREHWRSIRTNNPMERIMREIRRRTRVVGNFPDGRSALMLVTARLRYIAGKEWGSRRYMDMTRLNGLVRFEVLTG
ncbi:IS256 family transposase [Candidatus Oscillochloris fontis]|uniref:IS256 family transposase n=1 Tax=Candidatus Oscillochloris fontis TaxID=2496868 RepID=UPI00101C6FBE|nr:IS256 family transposase [Candidatus Oscillochloris fontis]